MNTNLIVENGIEVFTTCGNRIVDMRNPQNDYF